jgi:hypothetical protein
MGTVVSIQDCADPELVLARPIRWFKASEVKSLNGKPVQSVSDFVGKHFLNSCSFVKQFVFDFLDRARF